MDYFKQPQLWKMNIGFSIESAVYKLQEILFDSCGYDNEP
jgi:hypothetical protein